MITYIFLAMSIASLVLFLVYRNKNGSTFAVAIQTTASLFFVFIGLSSIIYNIKSKGIVEYETILPSIIVIGGLVCGLIGDILLDFKVYFKSLNSLYNNDFIKDHGNMTFVGMGVFGIGHILYIASLLIRFENSFKYLIISIIIGMVITALIFSLSLFVLKMNFRKYLVVSISYCVLLTTFIIFSAFLYAKNPSTNMLLLLIGSILFILSDLILSMTYFSKDEDYNKKGLLNPESKLMIVVNHSLYYIAQYLIAISLLYI